MDKNLERLERIFPNSKFVKIAKYDKERFEHEAYDSSKDCKSTTTKWKTEALSHAEAQEAVADGYRVGWIVPESYCVIDIDNHDNPRSQEVVERLLNYWEVRYNYNYTSRGIHLVFRDSNKKQRTCSKVKCGLNVEIDVRAAGTGYIVLPCNDPHRKWGSWSDNVEELPYFLRPVGITKIPSFIGYDDGDGRNDALWKWRNFLEQSERLTKAEVEKTIRAINENLFAVPLQNTELYSTVLRELDTEDSDSNDKNSDKGNKYSKLANELVKKRDLISMGPDVYSFNGVYYKPITDLEIDSMIYSDLSSNITINGRREIREFVKVKTQISPEDMNRECFKIACKNGVIDLRNGTLEAANKMEYNTIAIPCDFDPDPPYSSRIDQFIKEVANGDTMRMKLLYQIAGYCLVKDNFMAKFFIFQGNGGTGKSTYMRLVEKMCGTNNTSHVGLNKFDNDYYIASTMNKLVNIDDDLASNKALGDTGRFKSIVSGEIIAVRNIYRSVTKYRPFCTCIFSCNNLPRIMDNTAGLFRRMVLIELNHRVENPDPQFMAKLTDMDMKYFLFKAVEGIKQVIEEGKFAINDSEDVLLRKFQRKQSPLNEWLYENQIRAGELDGKIPSALYAMFREWCSRNGFDKPVSSTTFKDTICSMYGVYVGVGNELDKYGLRVQKFAMLEDADPEYFPF